MNGRRGGERRERTLAGSPPEQPDNDDAAGPSTVLELPTLTATREDKDPEAAAGADTQDAAPVMDEPDEAAPEAVRAQPTGPWSRAFRLGLKSLLWIVAFPILCLLPFIVVLRVAVVSYQQNASAGWEALGLGLAVAVLLVCGYIAAFMLTFRIPRRFFMGFLNVGLAAMLCYTGFALFHLSTGAAKTEEIRSYYTSLHPFLRVAIKNLTVFDEDLIITDVERTPEAYARMGLPPREYSLHFRQPTGFVHAVDLRTIDRSQVANLLLELYFTLMGFETIRHVGTADHLHVALPPGAAPSSR